MGDATERGFTVGLECLGSKGSIPLLGLTKYKAEVEVEETTRERAIEAAREACQDRVTKLLYATRTEPMEIESAVAADADANTAA